MVKKSILSLALVAALCLGLIPSTVYAAESDFVIKDVYLEDGRVFRDVLTVYNGPGGNVVIPDGERFVGLGIGLLSGGEGGGLFAGRTDITSVFIPDSAVAIGGSAFSGCTGLTSISIPHNVRQIATSAFSGCTGLTSLTIPGNVKEISTDAFSGCTSLTSLTLCEGIEYIGGDAFRGCTGLTSVTIPNSVTTLRGLSFAYCSNLSDVTIPATVNIPSNPFDETAWEKKQGEWIIINNTLIEYQGDKTAVVIPDNVTTIGGYWYGGDWPELKSVTIPNSVTTIADSAFNGLSGLTSIDIPNGVTDIGAGAFGSCGLTSVTLPDSVKTIGAGAFGGCYELTSITIPSSVTAIGGGVFTSCDKLTIHGSSGSYIEDYAKEYNIPFVADLAPVVTVGGFRDVQESEYFAQPVLWAVEKGITAGTSANTFSPNQVCTKAEILTFLWRSQGKPEPTINAPYSNLSPSDFYYKAALWACETGVVGSGDFGRECTRSFAVMYLWILAGKPSAPATNFTDVPSNADYAQAVAWAVQQGITSGTSATTFSPEATCTRGQIVTFLYRAYGKQA